MNRHAAMKIERGHIPSVSCEAVDGVAGALGGKEYVGGVGAARERGGEGGLP
jgi:hypothetical protein